MRETGGILSILTRLATRLSESVGTTLRDRVGAIVAAYRAEMHRTIAIFMLALVAILFTWTATVFAAIAILVALWETHRVVAATSAAAFFIVIAAISVFVIARLRAVE